MDGSVGNGRPSYHQFVEKLCKLYGTFYHPEMRFLYNDPEGDPIVVTSQTEWEEMFSVLSDQSIIKLKVIEVKGGVSFKDAVPEPVKAYVDPSATVPICQLPPEVSKKMERVPNCLKVLFPGEVILPHNVPSFLEEAVHVLPIRDNEVDLDVDIAKLESLIFRQGMDLLNRGDYQGGRRMFQSLIILNPEDKISTYNMACAEALLGNTSEAILALYRSCELGYNNFDHMNRDTDLDSIRNHPEYEQLLLQYNLDYKPPVAPIPCPSSVVLPQPVQQPIVPEVVVFPEVEVPPQPQEPPKEVVEEKIPQVVQPEQQQLQQQPEDPKAVVEEVDEGFNLCQSVELSPRHVVWSKELEVLHEIGYLDDDLLITYLEKTNGNIEQTVLDLLGDM